MKIEGQQINLRDWQHEDLSLLEYWLQPEHKWYKTDGPYYPPATAEGVRRKIETYRSVLEKGEFPEPRTNLAICSKQGDELLGSLNCYWISVETYWMAIGISIYNPSNWRKGIGYEALGLWVDYLFRARPEIVRLDIRTWSGNTGMLRLAEKLGFQLEARFRNARVVDGEYYDGIGYGILREEWNTKYPDGFSATVIPG